jgi:hypothetical protein
MHIENLYQDRRVLLFKEVYAMEKIHGCAAHVMFGDGAINYSSGAAKLAAFMKAVPPAEALLAAFNALGHPSVCVYGEAYGGSLQRMKATYNERLRFIAFEVMIGDVFLAVPQAEDVATKLGFEFVAWTMVPATIEALDAERDAPSVQSIRNGMGKHPREGIVIRPPIEVVDNAGRRLIAKHKRPEFAETATPREVDPAKAEVLVAAEAIALEWVTEMRLSHVLDNLVADGEAVNVSLTGKVVRAMIEDVVRESRGEIVDSREARSAIGGRAAKLFLTWLEARKTE